MTFLSPAWLFLALAAVVPVLIHLLRRRIGTRIELPTARYLARAEAEHSRELRLRNVALMLLRVAAILLLAIAAARPFVSLPGGARSPGSLAVVLDNTLSSAAVVGGAPVLDRLRATARVPLLRLRAGDRAWLITADAVVTAGTRDQLLATLDSVEPLATAGDLSRALTLASEAVQGSGLAGEVALLTDAQATQWSGRVPLAGRLVLFVPAEAPPPNRAVIEARPEPLRWSNGAGAVNVALLSNDSAFYRVAIGDQPVLRGIAEPDGRVRAPLTTHLRGWFSGTVQTERDELPLDDVRHFAAFAGPPASVTVAPDAGEYATTAVSTLIGRGRIVQGGGSDISPADIARRLPALLLPPLDPVRVGAANRALERLGVPWRFGDAVRDSVVARADSAEFAGMQPPRVYVRYRLVQAAADTSARNDTLATVAGEPWIVAGVGYVLLGSPLIPENSTLPVSAAFVPWLERTVAHRLTLDAIGIVEAATGDTVALPAWADSLGNSASRRIIVETPGVRFLSRQGRRVGAVVVNPPRRESLLERLSIDALRDRFPGATVLAVADAQRFDRSLLSTRGRTDLTAWALGLVVLLLLAELFLRGSLPATGARTRQ